MSLMEVTAFHVLREPQQYHAAGLAAHVAIRRVVQGLAAPIRRQHTGLGKSRYAHAC